MNLHFKTLLTIAVFVGIGVLVSISAQHYPILTLMAVAIAMFAAFYNLVYSLLKIEQSIDELKKK